MLHILLKENFQFSFFFAILPILFSNCLKQILNYSL